MIRPSTCSGIWQPCQPVHSLNVRQTRGTYHVSLSELKPSGTSCERRTQGSSQLTVEQDFQLGGERVANRSPERATWLEGTYRRTTPSQAPVDVDLGVALVVVDIVIIADIK
jgi:hypothetical protein